MDINQRKNIDDTYFRRFFVPIVISLLVIAGIFVIIAAPPGTPVNWKSTNSVFENAANNMVGGMRRFLSCH
jgi:hypothetical protein